MIDRGVLVCPETLEPLVEDPRGLRSPRGRVYPIVEGLLFSGFPERDREMIEETMAEERAWQGTPDTAERDLAFLRDSAPSAVSLSNVASRYSQADGQPRALELGAGSGWVSWLLAEAGYDTWICDFEANSLAIGQIYEHENLGEGRRIVADARYPPFADAQFDLVVCKEFVHHVADYRLLFEEANRVLRPGGVIALLEPTLNVVKAVRQIRHPDPHEGHVFAWLGAYRRVLRDAGFEIVYETALFAERENRFPLASWSKRRAARSVQGLAPSGFAARAHIAVFGDSSSMLVARKVTEAPRRPRPPMAVIPPETLVVGDAERAAFSAFPAVLRENAARLDRVPGGPPGR